MVKKVLLVSPFFYPEEISTGRYNTWLTRAMIDRGWEVTVLTSHPIYPKWIPEKSDKVIFGALTIRGGLSVYYPKAPILRRLTLELWFAYFVLVSYKRLKTKPDILISIFPPSLFFLLLLFSGIKNIYRVGIVHDLQGVYLTKSTSFFKKILLKIINFVEGVCFRSSDHLIFLSNSMANRAKKEYLLSDSKTSVFYPFPTMGDAPSLGENSRVDLESKLPRSKINIVYSGALGDKQNPYNLLNFLVCIARNHSEVICHIFSSGLIYDELKSHSLGLSCINLKFHDLVPECQLIDLYQLSDIQIVPQVFGLTDGSFPSKLPNLILAGVPIFVICEADSELAHLIHEADAGVVADSWSEKLLLDKFNNFLSSLNLMPRKARISAQKDFVHRKFSVESLLDEITKRFEA